MGGQSGILSRQEPPLVGHELPQQIDVLKIEGVDREVDFRFWSRRAGLGGGIAISTAAIRAIRVCLAGHMDYLISRCRVCRLK